MERAVDEVRKERLWLGKERQRRALEEEAKAAGVREEAGPAASQWPVWLKHHEV